MSIADTLKNLFSRKHDDIETENPYLNARRSKNDLSAASTENRQMWQLFGIMCLLILLAAVGGLTYIGSQSKFVPYIVELDKLGQTNAVAPADLAAVADPRVVHSSVAAFITDLRSVTPDVALQRRAIFRAYSMLSTKDPATVKVTEWFKGSEDSDPFKRAAKETVDIEISSVIPQSSETWQVDWVETTRDRQGVKKGPPVRWRALVTVYVVEFNSKTTEAQFRMNPLGLYVRDFSWSKQV